MPVFRVEKTKDYTVMSNYHLRDKSISLKAKGLLSQMLSLPPEWDYTLQGLAYINKEGKDSIREAVKELETLGYVTRCQARSPNGKFSGYDYVIHEQPLSGNPTSDNPTTVNPTSENPMTENPISENPTQINKEREKKEKENIDCINHRIISYPGSENMPTGSQKHDPSTDTMRLDERKSYEESLKENIEYDYFIKHDSKHRELVKEILEIMVDAGCSRSPFIRIGRDEKPTYIVKDRFLKLDSSHIQYVLECLDNNTVEVRNVKQYILTTLYNASMTIDSYYQQMVQHDMANW
ncbi:MAG: helix-turn-helix domain-containing protein [Oscillospiraceae bacterium]|nr:helix-turn-helix domain-containing protein [Oscillospiraceae bacterium]